MLRQSRSLYTALEKETELEDSNHGAPFSKLFRERDKASRGNIVRATNATSAATLIAMVQLEFATQSLSFHPLMAPGLSDSESTNISV